MFAVRGSYNARVPAQGYAPYVTSPLTRPALDPWSVEGHGFAYTPPYEQQPAPDVRRADSWGSASTESAARSRRRKWLIIAGVVGCAAAIGTVLGVLAGKGDFSHHTAAASSAAASVRPSATSGSVPTATSSQLPVPTGMPSNAQIEAADPLAWPNLQFISNPSANLPKAVAFSFDDGPGSSNSTTHTHVLDQLLKYNMKATFFINGNASVEVLGQPSAQAALRRTLAEGHTIGSHTYSHPRLTTLSPADVVAQFEKNLQVFRDPRVLGPSFTPTLIRAPFGAPFQANTSDVLWLAPLVAPYGVHVGWGIDTKDYECAENGSNVSCIVDRFSGLLDAGRSGVILMHSIYQLSGDALPGMFQELWNRNYQIITVEQMIAAKYGAASSADVMQRWGGRKFSADAVAAGAFNASRLNNDVGTAA